MTREEHLKFCKVCNNKAFDRDKGIICSLTGDIADFEGTCPSFDSSDELQKIEEGSSSNTLDAQMASMEKRFLNYVIDLICYFIFTFIFAIALGIMIGIFYPEWLDFIPEDNKLFDYVFGVIVGVIYYSTLEHLTGKSIGKYITKTHVVTEEGEKPEFKTIVLRSLCRYIPFEAFSFLAGGNTGWHDKLSKTRVLNDPIKYRNESAAAEVENGTSKI